MATTSDRRMTLVWIALVLATAGSWWMSVPAADSAASDRLLSSVLILTIAGVKIWLVMDWFMELREAAGLVRWVARGWLLSLLVVLIVVMA